MEAAFSPSSPSIFIHLYQHSSLTFLLCIPHSPLESFLTSISSHSSWSFLPACFSQRHLLFVPWTPYLFDVFVHGVSFSAYAIWEYIVWQIVTAVSQSTWWFNIINIWNALTKSGRQALPGAGRAAQASLIHGTGHTEWESQMDTGWGGDGGRAETGASGYWGSWPWIIVFKEC